MLWLKTKVEILTKHVSKLEKQLADIENVISLTKKKSALIVIF
ncbi:hypothetical protein [Bacillus siamensis]|nr:hypothetical protein [Bacillus siamensis]